MEDAAGDDEEMPDRMGVGLPLPHVKEYAHSVRDASVKEKTGAERRHSEDDLIVGDEKGPAHHGVHHRREHPETAQIDRADDHAQNGHSPDDAEIGPAPGSAQHCEHDGGVGARDEHKNRRMVHARKDAFGRPVGHRMVEG